LGPKQEFDEFESQLIGTKTKRDSNDLKENKQAGDEEEEDEKEIEEEQRERMSALTKADSSVKSDFNKTLIRFDYREEEEGEKESNIKAFSSAALLKIKDMLSGNILMVNDIWSLPVEERIRFTQMLVAKRTHGVYEEFQAKLRTYEDTCKQNRKIENQQLVSILRKKQLIGVTITGASLNQQLLREIRPEIVIVEEAAEVNSNSFFCITKANVWQDEIFYFSVKFEIILRISKITKTANTERVKKTPPPQFCLFHVTSRYFHVTSRSIFFVNRFLLLSFFLRC